MQTSIEVKKKLNRVESTQWNEEIQRLLLYIYAKYGNSIQSNVKIWQIIHLHYLNFDLINWMKWFLVAITNNEEIPSWKELENLLRKDVNE